MNDKLRKKLLKIDYKIYLLNYEKSILISNYKLKTEKSSKKRNKLFADMIYHPFSSEYQTPFPSIVNEILKIKPKAKKLRK